jgi:hypothetical protein
VHFRGCVPGSRDLLRAIYLLLLWLLIAAAVSD